MARRICTAWSRRANESISAPGGSWAANDSQCPTMASELRIMNSDNRIATVHAWRGKFGGRAAFVPLVDSCRFALVGSYAARVRGGATHRFSRKGRGTTHPYPPQMFAESRRHVGPPIAPGVNGLKHGRIALPLALPNGGAASERSPSISNACVLLAQSELPLDRTTTRGHSRHADNDFVGRGSQKALFVLNRRLDEMVARILQWRLLFLFLHAQRRADTT